MPIRISATWLMLAPCAALSIASEPPRPDRDAPIDYLAWVNREYAVDEAQNAAPKYRAAIAAYVDQPDLAQAIDHTLGESWSADQLAALRPCVDANTKAISLLVVAACRPQCYFKLESESGTLLDARLPETDGLRKLATLLAIDARVKLDAGFADAATTDVVTLLRMARHMESQPGGAPQLIGHAYRKLAYAFLLGLPAHAGAKFDYAAVLKALRSADSPPPTLEASLTLDYVKGMDIVQRYAKDENNDGQPDVLRLPEGQIIQLPEGTTWATLVDSKDPVFENCRKLARRPDYPAAMAFVARLDNPVVSEFLGMPMRQYDTYLHAFCEWCQTRAASNAVHIVLAYHDFRARQGRWPRDLTEATRDEKAAIRWDPFSGDDLIYRLRDGQPFLYSVSLNGTDDRGQPAQPEHPALLRWKDTGDYVFWPIVSR